MKPNEFNLLMDEMKKLASQLDNVRTKDIPDVKTDIKLFGQRLNAVEKKQTWVTSISTMIGGAISFALFKLTGGSH